MVSQTVYFRHDGFHPCIPDARVEYLYSCQDSYEYLPTSTSTSTSTITLELTSTSKVRVPEIQYSSTASTSTEYKYPSPVGQSLAWLD